MGLQEMSRPPHKKRAYWVQIQFTKYDSYHTASPLSRNFFTSLTPFLTDSLLNHIYLFIVSIFPSPPKSALTTLYAPPHLNSLDRLRADPISHLGHLLRYLGGRLRS